MQIRVKTVLTAGPFSPLFPLRPVGPGPPCMIERIQQTWSAQVTELIQILHKLTIFFYNQYECITHADFTVAQSS